MGSIGPMAEAKVLYFNCPRKASVSHASVSRLARRWTNKVAVRNRQSSTQAEGGADGCSLGAGLEASGFLNTGLSLDSHPLDELGVKMAWPLTKKK